MKQTIYQTPTDIHHTRTQTHTHAHIDTRKYTQTEKGTRTEGEHADVEEDGANHGRGGALPQGGQAFLANDAAELTNQK
jgi:hypothetical protein